MYKKIKHDFIRIKGRRIILIFTKISPISNMQHHKQTSTIFVHLPMLIHIQFINNTCKMKSIMTSPHSRITLYFNYNNNPTTTWMNYTFKSSYNTRTINILTFQSCSSPWSKLQLHWGAKLPCFFSTTTTHYYTLNEELNWWRKLKFWRNSWTSLSARS